MASFRSHSFHEGGEGTNRFPVWSRRAKVAILEIPGANSDTVQDFGRKSDTLALLITCSADELTALYADVGQTGTLSYSLGDDSAYLQSIEPHEVLADRDTYVATLSFIRQ